MTELIIWRRCMLPARAAALATTALLGAMTAAAAQDDGDTPNVIVDDSALDSLPEAAADSELLPPPENKPISRVVRDGDSAIESQTPPETTTDSTFASVPTTPISSSDLSVGGADGPDAPFESEGTSESVIPDSPVGSTSTATSDEPIVATTSSEPATAEVEDSSDAAGAEPAEAPAPDSSPAAGSSDGEEETAEGDASTEEVEEVEQTAAVPPIEGMIRIVYAPEASAVTDAAKELAAPLIAKLDEDYGLRLQILAYAEGDEDESTHARGVSLARALAMRDYLTEQGISLDRMDLKALGNSAREEPADRVDLLPVPE